MSDPADDRMMHEYLARKSALSLGYRRLYVEEPPPELDQAIAARARRALRYLVPGILATVIAGGLLLGTSYGITKMVDMAVRAEKNLNRLEKERKEQEEKQRMEAPVSVLIDAGSLNTNRGSTSVGNAPGGNGLSREAWLARIAELKRTGTAAQVEAELRRFRAAYPSDPATKSP